MLLSSIFVSFLTVYILWTSGLQVIHILITPLPRDKNKKRGYPRLDRNILSYLKKAATYSPALQAVPSA